MSFLGTRIANLADETDRNRNVIGWLKDEVALPVGGRSRRARQAGEPLRARLAESGWQLRVTRRIATGQAERAALVQRLQLDVLHLALQSLERQLEALERESARQIT